ncbi:MAG: hypothetical protein P1P76_04445 [Anaerolineales bacterium]|nr:hypothetical protein [Anaerolineales bacterium]
MNKGLRNTLIALVTVIAAAALVLVGVNFGSRWWGPAGYAPWSMMGSSGFDDWDQGYGRGPGMMGYNQSAPGGYFGGMMNGGMMMGSGMMGSSGSNSLLGVEPLSLEQVEEAINDYLDAFDDNDLEVGEIMVFDNHAYVQIVEKSTGIGAMEVLVDPVTGTVFPEYGPNMMWNLKYSPMAGSGMMGASYLPSSNEELNISESEAVEIAQRYLDAYLPGAEADEHADPFYGYYTLHINRDGETVGMLSVNGYSRSVFLHTWHGDLIEMSGEAGEIE